MDLSHYKPLTCFRIERKSPSPQRSTALASTTAPPTTTALRDFNSIREEERNRFVQLFCCCLRFGTVASRVAIALFV